MRQSHRARAAAARSRVEQERVAGAKASGPVALAKRAGAGLERAERAERRGELVDGLAAMRLEVVDPRPRAPSPGAPPPAGRRG